MRQEYTGKQSILNVTLGEYMDKGFRLVEIDDHVLRLYYRDEPVAMFSQSGATVASIRDECEKILGRNIN